MNSILNQTAHRPWPLPKSSWRVTQTWENLLFAHWIVDGDELKKIIPKPLELDLFAGQAYVGVVAFDMNHIRPRWMPPLPTAYHFPEINVRTYVRYQDKPGVYFLSLDGMSRLAAWCARAIYDLPYYYSKISFKLSDDKVSYHSSRQDKRGEHAEFKAKFWPHSTAYTAQKETLDYWLTERYCLYCINQDGSVSQSDVHHLPWKLQNAQAEIQTNSMIQAAGLSQKSEEPLLHFSKYIHALLWRPEKVD